MWDFNSGRVLEEKKIEREFAFPSNIDKERNAPLVAVQKAAESLLHIKDRSVSHYVSLKQNFQEEELFMKMNFSELNEIVTALGPYSFLGERISRFLTKHDAWEY